LVGRLMVLDELINTAVRQVEEANKETESHVRRVTGSRVIPQVWLTRDVCESLKVLISHVFL
jgi:hypothetical protein